MTFRDMRVGLICSAGGSAFLAAADICPDVEFRVVTDRACGVEAGCARRDIACVRVDWSDRQSFSTNANRVLSANGACTFVVMLFSRLVSAPLIGDQRLLNVHPSLLPAFKGIGAVARAHQAGARVLGATLHVVDEQMDNGPVVAQASCPTASSWSLADWQHVSFVQKTALVLLAIELAREGRLPGQTTVATPGSERPSRERLNPMLTTPSFLSGLRRLQRSGFDVL